MPRCSAAGLDFRIIPAGFNAPLEFLTGFTHEDFLPFYEDFSKSITDWKIFNTHFIHCYFLSNYFLEVSEKPLKSLSETSDYTDFKKMITRRFLDFFRNLFASLLASLFCRFHIGPNWTNPLFFDRKIMFLFSIILIMIRRMMTWDIIINGKIFLREKSVI
jgi:hypothetical protein